jgi:hypothetical protein
MLNRVSPCLTVYRVSARMGVIKRMRRQNAAAMVTGSRRFIRSSFVVSMEKKVIGY